MSGPDIEPLGESAWLLRWGEGLDEATNRRVHAFASRLREQAPDWLADVVPAYASLAVMVHPVDADRRLAARAWLAEHIEACSGDPAPSATRTVEIPVSYGGAHGPDLVVAASALGLSPDDLAERHANGRYAVAMIGFAPGFPYLLGLDPALALPRHERPRERVPAGSVGIGGAQTGIYPGAGAGGWQLLGRTPLRLFDPRREAPALLQAGDRVRLVAIDADAFDRRVHEPGGLDAD